jgi:transposase
MLQLSALGFSAQEVAKIHDCADVAVYKWIDRFDAEGL